MSDEPRIDETPATTSAMQAWEEAKRLTDVAEIEMQKSWSEAEEPDQVVQNTEIEVGWNEDGSPRGGDFRMATHHSLWTSQKAQQKMAEWINARGIESVALGVWEQCRGEDYIRLSDSLRTPLDDWRSVKVRVEESGINVRYGRVWSRKNEVALFADAFVENRNFRRYGIIALIVFIIVTLVGKQSISRLATELGSAIVFLVVIYMNRTKRSKNSLVTLGKGRNRICGASYWRRKRTPHQVVLRVSSCRKLRSRFSWPLHPHG